MNFNSIVFQVKEVAPEARRRDAMLSFAFVYPDKFGRFVVREVSIYSLSIPSILCSIQFIVATSKSYNVVKHIKI